MNRQQPPSWSRRSEAAANSWRSGEEPTEEFGTAESVGGIAGDSTIGANHSTTEDGSLSVKRPKSDVSYYENDSVMLWSDDPEKEYFKYMLQREQENRARQGKSAQDSLIGDSTLEEIQQEFSKWHQTGGGQQLEYDPTEREDASFPVLSSSHKGGRMHLDGFSLATDEKSPPKQPNQQAQQQPASSTPATTPDKKPDELFPHVIYVTDTPATSIALSKPSHDSTASRRLGRRSNWFFFALFFLGGLCLSAAAIAIYMTVSAKQRNNNNDSNTASSLEQQQDNNGDEILWWSNDGTGTSSSFRPTDAPSLRPSVVASSSETISGSTLAPTTTTTTTVPESTSKPTLRPTTKPTMAPISSPTTPSPTPNPTEPPTTPQPTTAQPTDAPTTIYCGCQHCDHAINRMADGFTCGERMQYLVQERGYSELGACRLVAAVEFPTTCGPLCNPDECQSAGQQAAVLELRGNNGQPPHAFPLEQCEGDCDSDDDCGSGMVCFQRDDDTEPVPGCRHGDSSANEGATPTSETDFCILEGHANAATTRQEEEGDDFFPHSTTEEESSSILSRTFSSNAP